MTVQSAQSVTVLFTTRNAATSAGVNADSLPTGTLYLNGTANGATVVVTNISTGLYKAAVTMPTLAAGDQVEIAIAATVNSISDKGIIWGDTNDFIGSAGALTTVTTVTNQLTAAAIATGVWTDTTAGDFTTSLSIGKSVMNGVSLGTGLTINGYTGNTVQTGDSYARLGAAGAGLTALGDTRIANLDATVTSRLASASYTAPPTANANADALLDRAAGVETGITPRQGFRLMLAALAGKLSGAATASVSIRDTGDSKNRIVATVDSHGNRSSVTLDAS